MRLEKTGEDEEEGPLQLTKLHLNGREMVGSREGGEEREEVRVAQVLAKEFMEDAECWGWCCCLKEGLGGEGETCAAPLFVPFRAAVGQKDVRFWTQRSRRLSGLCLGTEFTAETGCLLYTSPSPRD